MIIVPTLHPAALLRSEDERGSARFRHTVIGDLAKAASLEKGRVQWDEAWLYEPREGFIPRSLFPTLATVHEFAFRARLNGYLVIDVETTGESPLEAQLICVGLGTLNQQRLNDARVLCVPFLQQGGSRYWSPGEEAQVHEILRDLLADIRITKVFHNNAFDCCVLWAHRMPVSGPIHDTMQAHHVLDGEMPMNLGFVASTRLHTRFWKDDVKGAAWLSLDDHTLRLYNVRDVATTMALDRQLGTELYQAGSKLVQLYRDEIALTQIMMRATIRGMAVDFQRRDSQVLGKDGLPEGLGPKLRLQMADALARLREIAGGPIEPMKALHLRYLFFHQLKFAVLKKTKSDLPSTDKEALMLLALSASTPTQKAAIKALVDFRTAQKLLSTFVEGLEVLGDGRLHASWKLLTVSGRFSSSPNCFDAETEVLVEDRGWVALPEVTAQDRVAQWDGGAITFVEPEIVRGTTAEFVHVTNQHIDLMMTPDHRALLRHRKTGELRVFRADAYPEDWQQIHAGTFEGRGIEATLDEIRLAVALQADGHTDRLKCGTIQFALSLQRKVDRCEALFRRLGVQFKKSEKWNLPDRPYRAWFTIKDPRLVELMQQLLGSTKTLGWWVLKLDRAQLDAFVDELWWWDGCSTRQNNYSSSIKVNADVVQAALVLSGRRANLREYVPPSGRTNWQTDVTSRDYSLTTNVGRQRVPVSPGTPTYCVSVPSSFVLVRRRGKTAITGNCQNWGKPIKRIFRAGPGMKLIGIDLSQAELRGIAYVARATKLLEMYDQGLNVHTANSALVFKVRAPQGHKDLNSQTEAWLRSTIPNYDALPQIEAGAWKGVRTLTKNAAFGISYGAEDETAHKVLRSKRDPDSGDLLFPDIKLSEVTAFRAKWTNELHPEIPKWWAKVVYETQKNGGSTCPISGRRRLFRGGFKRNEMINVGIQTLVASHVNKAMIEIQGIFDKETNGAAQIIQQVHDALNVEGPAEYAKRAGDVMLSVLNRPFPLPGFPNATLPADNYDIDDHLDKI